MAVENPMALFAALFARAGRECAEPDAMVLSTVDPEGRPSARYVLLKGVDERAFEFNTNLGSRNARAQSLIHIS
jgi:pyridoxamine 5'-phosphate oxidase